LGEYRSRQRWQVVVPQELIDRVRQLFAPPRPELTLEQLLERERQRTGADIVVVESEQKEES
jgi:hypothetical protein